MSARKPALRSQFPTAEAISAKQLRYELHEDLSCWDNYDVELRLLKEAHARASQRDSIEEITIELLDRIENLKQQIMSYKELLKFRDKSINQSQRTVEDLMAEVHNLNSEMIKKEKCYNATLREASEELAALKEELAKKIDELNIVSMQNADMKSELKHIVGISCTMEEELADKIEATGRLEVELIDLRSSIEEKNSKFQSLKNELSKVLDEKQCCETQVLMLQEKLEMAQTRADESGEKEDIC